MALRRQDVVGTDVPNAFLASLNEDADLSMSGYGIHGVPHVGVYGDSYTIALPMILLSLPTSFRFLKRLPYDILGALDLVDEYDHLLVGVARQLVQQALDAAHTQYEKLLLQLAAEEEYIVKMAKVIVRKVLHRVLGGQREPDWEEWDGNRSDGDVEELVARAKRLKIMEDSPPLSASTSADDVSRDSGITLSSDAMITVTSYDDDIDNSGSKSGKKRQRSGSHDISMMKEGEKLYTKCKGKGDTLSVSDLISNIRKMSIMESKEEGEEEREREGEGGGEGEEQYVVLQPVTKQCDDEPVANDPSLLHPEWRSLPNLECYVIVHKYPVPGMCQKFMCSNTNEINILYHTWLYRDLPVDPELSVTQQVDMGIFEPSNVAPVHLDLQDGGIPFYHLQPRTVCIHNCCFSPENAQLQLKMDSNSLVHHFYSVGSNGERKVITYHVVPANKIVQDALCSHLEGCADNLGQLVNTMVALLPELNDSFLTLFGEFFNP